MDTVEPLRLALVEEVERIKDECNYPDLGRAFQHWSIVNVLGIDDNIVEGELEGGMGPDGGIDYFHVDKDTKTIEIVQAKFTNIRGSQVEPKAILELYEIPRKLLFNNSDHNSRFREQQELYKKYKNKNYATRLLFITTGNLSNSVKDTIMSKNQNMSGDTTFECFGIDDLIAYVGNPISRTCELQLNKVECFIGRSNETQIKRMVATISAPELKKLCNFVGVTTLFSLNPRSFLGAKSRISKKIKKTIEDEPERLWHYNNGISAICKHFHYNIETGIVQIENLKVVNGCQTISTIANMKDVDPNAGLVLRLSETSDTAFSENISVYTNDQTAIKRPDLSSNHPHLKELEQKFRKYDRFFFERKRGQRPSLKSKQNLYLIKNVDGARLKMAYSGKPHLSMQLPEAEIFNIDPDESNETSPFFVLYKNADPRDFIIPKIFYYLLNVIKRQVGKNNVVDTDDKKNMRFLLKYKIGQYYVIGLIGKIFCAMDPNTKNSITDAIINSAVEYDSEIMDKIITELSNLVMWLAHLIPEVLDDDSNMPLHMQKTYYLRDPLRKDNKLPKLYHKRQAISKYTGGKDIFETKLCEIFNIPHV